MQIVSTSHGLTVGAFGQCTRQNVWVILVTYLHLLIHDVDIKPAHREFLNLSNTYFDVGRGSRAIGSGIILPFAKRCVLRLVVTSQAPLLRGNSFVETFTAGTLIHFVLAGGTAKFFNDYAYRLEVEAQGK